jgi:hypothetical protein
MLRRETRRVNLVECTPIEHVCKHIPPAHPRRERAKQPMSVMNVRRSIGSDTGARCA